jgi:hypothetical protein
MHPMSFRPDVERQTEVGCPVSGCMEETVRETLDTVAALATPVVRTCHIGNLTANNFGWLALARNTYFGQMEHTLYGVDDIYLPWVALGDDGRVETFYDHTGRPHPSLAGRHANELRGLVARRHSSLFSFGIFAEHRGEDLISHHVHTAERLGESLNGARVVPRSAEVLHLRPLLTGLIRHFFRRRLLHLLFHKWVRTTRAGHVTMLRIKEILYEGGEDLAVFTTDSSLSFRGSLEDLLAALFSGMAAVAGRLQSGLRFSALSYPWITTCFNLVMNAVKEHALDPDQRVFWHAVAATNHTYVNQAWFQEELAAVTRELERGGFLPEGAELRLIPTYACQLFATGEESLAELELLVALWRDHLRTHPERTRRMLAALAGTTAPAAVVDAFFPELPRVFLDELAERLTAFNEIDPHHLPIAYAAGSDHTCYNKYGIAQSHLLGKPVLFPSGLFAMRWGEAELLVKTLGRITMNERR